MAWQTGLEPEAAEHATWRYQATAEKEAAETARRAEEASAQAWERAVWAQGQIAMEPAWPARERNLTPDVMVLEPRTKEEREAAGRTEMVDGVSEFDEHIVMDTPPRANPGRWADPGEAGREPQQPARRGRQQPRMPQPGAPRPWWSPNHGRSRTQRKHREQAGPLPAPRP